MGVCILTVVIHSIALLFLDGGTRMGWVVSSTPRPHFTPGKDPVPTVQEAGWAPGSVWTRGKSHPHRDSITDPPARSQSLYRLSYPARRLYGCTVFFPIISKTARFAGTSFWINIYIYIFSTILSKTFPILRKGQIEVTRRRGRRRKKLLDDLKDRRGYCQLKEEALDRTMWRNRFGRGFGPVVWQITDDDDYIYSLQFCLQRFPF